MPQENNNFSNNNEFEEESGVDSENVETTDTISFDDSDSEQEALENDYPEEGSPSTSNNTKSNIKKKLHKRFSLKTLAVSIIVAIVAAVMLTYSVCSSIYKSMYAQAYLDANLNSSAVGGFSEFDIVAGIFDTYSYNQLNKDEMLDAAIKAYVESSGDLYAAYYNAEELKELENENQGKMIGIGISVINETVSYNGEEIFVLNIVNVIENSPAAKAGIETGDLISKIEINNTMQSITDLGFDVALSAMKGVAGSSVKLTILRKNGNSFVEKILTATRQEIVTMSVYSRVYTLNPEIGVIRISTFDDTTPAQFEAAIESLKAQQCKKFVIDLRNNIGGSLSSFEKIASFFVNKDTTFMRVKNNKGKIEEIKIQETSYFSNDKSPCAIKKEDIGKYSNLEIAIICNEYTASSAELFVSLFKDYNLAPVVGTKTYGKGTIQSVLDGSIVQGMTGAIVLTTHESLSPLGNSFNIQGITPDADKLEPLSEEAKKYSIYELSDNLDNQLQKAVKFLNN